jgi:hypothetical protein
MNTHNARMFFRPPSRSIRLVRMVAFLTIASLTGVAQRRPMQRPLSPSVFGKYDYKVVFDTTKPIGGKQARKIQALDIDDDGNVALIALCTDNTIGLWTSKLGWVTWSNQPNAVVDGIAGRVVDTGTPQSLALTPEGDVKYRVNFGTAKPAKSYQGYFVNGKFIFDEGPLQAQSDVTYMPDGKLLYTSFRHPERNEGSTVMSVDPKGSGKGTDLLPPSLNLQQINALTASKSGGAYAFLGNSIDKANQYHIDLFVNGARAEWFKSATYSGARLFVNAKGEVAFDSRGDVQTIFMNGLPTRFIGKMFDFNDSKDILLQDEQTLLVNENAVAEVVPPGDRPRDAKFPHGVPEMKDLGVPYGFNYPAMNAKRQVAIAVQFLPVGQQLVFKQFGDIGAMSINGLPDPWWVVVATPK